MQVRVKSMIKTICIARQCKFALHIHTAPDVMFIIYCIITNIIFQCVMQSYRLCRIHWSDDKHVNCDTIFLQNRNCLIWFIRLRIFFPILIAFSVTHQLIHSFWINDIIRIVWLCAHILEWKKNLSRTFNRFEFFIPFVRYAYICSIHIVWPKCPHNVRMQQYMCVSCMYSKMLDK